MIPHAVQQMIRRRIDRLSVIRCLKRGVVTEGPAPELGTGNWRCVMEAQIDGERLRVVVEIPTEGLLVITAVLVE